MIQAIGLTSSPRRNRPPAVDDLTFEARPGEVTVLLGPAGAGKSSALRLMLQLVGGRGTTLFRGRPLHRVPHVPREIGVMLGDVPAHPARTAVGHLRMLTAVAGVPAERAEELLDVVGLSGLADQRLATFSQGMDRRLGLAAALLGDPHTLVLDDPAGGLSPREAAWVRGLLRGFAQEGGLVLTTTRDPVEALRVGDRVITIEAGRLVADQSAAEFSRTRLRPRVVVATPHAERLAALILREAKAGVVPVARSAPGQPAEPLEVVRESGGVISVYGSSCAMVGEVAYRHGVLVHQLAERRGGPAEAAPTTPSEHGLEPEAVPLLRADGRRGARLAAEMSSGGRTYTRAPALSARQRSESDPGPQPSLPSPHAASGTSPQSLSAASTWQPEPAPPARKGGEQAAAPGAAQGAVVGGSARSAAPRPRPTSAKLPPRLRAVPAPGPAWPLRYEWRRLVSVRSTWLLVALALLASLATACWFGGVAGAEAYPRLFGEGAVGWPMAPVAVAAGVLGALAFGQEFRYPALAPAQAPVPRRLGLLSAKLLTVGLIAIVLCSASALINAAVLSVLPELAGSAGSAGHAGQGSTTAGPAGAGGGTTVATAMLLAVGCGWAGLLSAAVFRSAVAGIGVVLAVPLLVEPLVRRLLAERLSDPLGALSDRLARLSTAPWAGAEEGGWLTGVLDVALRPTGAALAVSLTGLLVVYLFGALRARPR
ncbi:ATP-binding cassette domain-containing protein [Streptomyces sp. OF3]|uniref:ATP-binding cassette domain-containing protein n=1 Tax=Streptomyces alkaliterrae TaxID=2213162 RepID=A0A7W3WMB2_9ACTN|nr:ABC transporter ATP-binding protein [Streptomyces alkaliterrae]MBB1254978.1 ATP-binding cassette domain-containing protein [Streptomyces alkaliterrae]